MYVYMYVEPHELPELTGHRLADSGGLLDGHVSEGRARWGVRKKKVRVCICVMQDLHSTQVSVD